MKSRKLWSIILMGAALGTSFTSCVDADIDDALEYEDTYTNVNDADKHILGVYSKFMELGEQMVVLGELRGDLMDITDNSNTYLQEVAAKVDDSANPYLDPTPFYSVINECNDCLYNFDLMKERHDMTEDEYNERYSDIASLRCYVYLQLAIQFGRVPYVTTPIVSISDMKEMESKAEWLSTDELLPRLISVMESLPFLNQYEESSLVLNPVTSASTTVSGEQLSYYFVYKKLLLADLYLWNSQYREAAALYKEVLDIDSDGDDTNNYERYKCAQSTSKDVLGNFYEASLSRFQGPNINAYTTKWPNMFSDALTSTAARYEWIWAITYPTGTTPQYPFVSLFASTDEGGNYQLRPSASCLYNFNRLDRLRGNGSPYDTRGADATYRVTTSGDTVCAKYLYMYDPAVPYEQEGRLWLYRAPMVQLRYAECMNRLGYPELAWALIVPGLVNYYGTSYPSDVTRTSNPRDYRGQHSIFDLLKPVTMGLCTTETDSALLFFDTRFYTSNSANPFDGYARRGPWRQSAGLRSGRACMENVTDANFSTKTLATCATREDSIYLVEKILMDEAALELAHEGNRFGDLVRVARRMNREGNDGMSGTEYFKALMDRKAQGSQNVLGVPDYSAGESSWYLPFH